MLAAYFGADIVVDRVSSILSGQRSPSPVK